MKINGAQKTYLPEPNDGNLQFTNYHKGLKVPFVIYADFESITQPIEQVQREETKSYTDHYQLHMPCGYVYKVVCTDEQYTKDTVVYRGQDCVEKFLKAVNEEKWRIWNILNEPKPLCMMDENQADFEATTHCHICGEALESDRVRDHCHITGAYRGAAHDQCNLRFRIPTFIPVVFHNLKGYDSHLIMQHLGKLDAEITCIPNNTERYVSFTIADRYQSKQKPTDDDDVEDEAIDGANNRKRSYQSDEPPAKRAKESKKKVSRSLNLRFIDSLAFMNASLDSLVKNLKTSGAENFVHLNREFDSPVARELLTKKGSYPYDYMNSFERFEETQLPPQAAFYSKLNEQEQSDEDYEHAKAIWSWFGLRSMGQYHDLYLKTDVLLLSDVFENFRSTCLSNYELDPAHYFTAPGLSWDACLRHSNVTLELLSDPDMHMMFEKGIRGGISIITHRHAKANNKYLSSYDPAKESSYIVYLDANNLYGWAMSQYLPTGGFRWLDEEEVNDLDVDNIPEDGSKGYILEVDLEYPEELHGAHDQYPLAPEKILVTDDMLSSYSKRLKDKFDMGSSKVPKLIPNLMDKTKYVVHYRNLQLYLRLGLKLKKIHRVIEFNQAPWMKEYIDFNTLHRQNASNPFEKDFFKLMNNSVFGKTMENQRNKVNVKLVNDERTRTKLVSQPHFKSMKIFTEDFTGIEMRKKSIQPNKPIYCGFTILDNSKVLMYDFHYNFIKARYGSQATLLFTGTDSLVYEIKTEDIYRDMFQRKELFDFSDYPTDCPFYDETNRKLLGKFKDETASVPIVEFVGLRSKMYSFNTEEHECKKAKGVKNSVVRRKMRHQDYLKTLNHQTRSVARMRAIRSTNHRVTSCEINKIGLSCYDDKRYIMEDGKATLAFGNCQVLPLTLKAAVSVYHSVSLYIPNYVISV